MNWNRGEGRGGEGQSHALSLSCYDGPGGQLCCLALELGSPGLTSGLSPYQRSDSHMFSTLPEPSPFLSVVLGLRCCTGFSRVAASRG